MIVTIGERSSAVAILLRSVSRPTKDVGRDGRFPGERVERSQRWEVGTEPVGADLEHVLRTGEVAKLMGTKIDEADVGDDNIADEFLGGVRAHNLATVRNRRDSCRAIYRSAVVVAVAKVGFPRVDPHPDVERFRECPGLCGQRPLCVDRCGESVVGRGECGVEAIARGLDHVAAALVDGVAQDLIVTGQGVAHPVRMLLPESSGTLEIREQERNGPSGQIADMGVLADDAFGPQGCDFAGREAEVRLEH